MDSANLPEIINYIDQHGLRVWLIQALARAFREARKNKLTTFNEHAYDVHWMENIIHLADAILERYYEPSASISFVIYDPMVREIFAAPFTDRVVHHFLYQMQGGWWDRRFIHDSYSCREGKGTLYGIRRAQKMMCQVTDNFTRPAYVIKLDIRGYFMSLPRAKIYERVRWGLERQFSPYFEHSAAYEVYRICDFLWRKVLYDNPIQKSRRRGPLSDWDSDNLPPEKSLYTQPPGRGIVIGNLTSQLVSNIYLDQLDRFVKFHIGYKYYGRYVDDFFIMVPAADYKRAKRDVKRIEAYLADDLLIKMHPRKRYFQSVYKGLPFLGARIYPHCLYPSNRLQKKFQHTLYELKYGQVSDETVISYLGFFRHLNADKYVRRMFERYELDFSLYQEIQSPKRTRPVPEIIAELRGPRSRPHSLSSLWRPR